MRDGNSPTPDEPVQRASTTSITRSDAEPGTVHVIVGAERTRIVLAGEVDATLAPELLDAGSEAEKAGLPVEVDVHHVTFMDSSGVAFLARLAGRSAHRVRLLRVPPTVRFLLEVTRIGELLDVVDEAPDFDTLAPEDDGPRPA